MRQLSDKSSVVNSFYFALVSFETFVFEGRGVCVSVEVFQSNGTTSQGIQILWIPVATGLHARFVKLGISQRSSKKMIALFQAKTKIVEWYFQQLAHANIL